MNHFPLPKIDDSVSVLQGQVVIMKKTPSLKTPHPWIVQSTLILLPFLPLLFQIPFPPLLMIIRTETPPQPGFSDTYIPTKGRPEGSCGVYIKVLLVFGLLLSNDLEVQII